MFNLYQGWKIHGKTLYQHSYLGYGLNEARKRIQNILVTIWKEEVYKSGKVYHPCLPLNHEEDFESTNGTLIKLIGTGAGHAECRGIIKKVFNKNKVYDLAPCAFDGVYQPHLVDTFKVNDLYVFSYFVDLTEPLGMPSEFTVRELGELTERVCKGETTPFQHVPNAVKTLEENLDLKKLMNEQHRNSPSDSKKTKIGTSWEKKTNKVNRPKAQLDERHKIHLLNFYNEPSSQDC